MASDQYRLFRVPGDKGIRGLCGRDLRLVCSTVLVQFLIGPSKEEYHLSKPLVASLSNSLSDTLSDLSSEGGEGVNVKPVIDWSHHIDTDIFNLFVQYAYTGGYDLVREQNVLKTHQLYPADFWIYESSPFVETPTPASVCRQHAQIWVFARFHNIHKIHDLGEVAQQKLRTSLKNLIRSAPYQTRSPQSDHYFDLAIDQFREVVDVIGYIYYQGRRFWDKGTRAHDGMISTIASFARTYLCDCDLKTYNGTRNLSMWESLVEKEPRIAVDMVTHNTKKISWT